MTSKARPEPQAMTTAGLQAKVTLRRAWFEAHPNQPMPEGRDQVERLFAAIEEEAVRDAARASDDLGAAWAEAEAALPADKFHELRVGKLNGSYWADGWHVDMPMTAGRDIGITTYGPTPAAALRALAAALREKAS